MSSIGLNTGLRGLLTAQSALAIASVAWICCVAGLSFNEVMRTNWCS